MDMHTQPDKVLKACEALMPHLCHVGLTTADPAKQVPIGFWMHRGCVPFINPKTFASHYWPTLKPIIEEFWKNGHQTLFYAEGKWQHHFDTFRELPDRSIVFHCDQDDIFDVHRKLHDKFALSGGIPNVLLSYGKPDEVRDFCRRVIDEVAARRRLHHGRRRHHAGRHQHREHPGDDRDDARARRLFSAGSYKTPVATPPCELPASVADRQKLNGMKGRPQPQRAARRLFPVGSSGSKNCPRSPAARTSSARSGRTLTPSATCTSGNCLLSF